MLDFPKWKGWGVIAIILAGLWFATPSLVPADKPPSWAPPATRFVLSP